MHKRLIAFALLSLFALSYAQEVEEIKDYFYQDFREDKVAKAFEEASKTQDNIFKGSQKVITNLYGIDRSIAQIYTGTCPVEQPSTYSITSIIGPSFLAIVIVLLIAILYYLLGKAFQSTLRGTYWIVLDEALTTVLVLIIFFALSSVFYMNGQSPFIKVGAVYLKNVLVELSYSLAWLSFLNFIWWNIYTYQLPVPFTPTWDVSAAFYVGQTIRPLIDATMYISNAINGFIGIFMSQLVLLCFIPVFVYGIAMPIGILLRAFSITRGAGNFLIALSFSFLFIYPLFLNLAFIIYKADYAVFSKYSIGFPEIIRENVIKSMGVGVLFFALSKISAILSTVLGGTTEQSNVFASSILAHVLIISTIFTFNSIYLSVFKLANFIFLLGVFMPVLTAYIVLASAIEFSERLGTRFDFSTFLRIL